MTSGGFAHLLSPAGSQTDPKKKAGKMENEKDKDIFRPATQQDMADGFEVYAVRIIEKLNFFINRQDDPEIAKFYFLYQQVIANWIKLNKENIKDCPILPELPTLIGNDYFAGLIRLEKYCTKARDNQIKGQKQDSIQIKKTIAEGTIFEEEEGFEDILEGTLDGIGADAVGANALQFERDRKMLSDTESFEDFLEKLDVVVCRWTIFRNEKDRTAAKEAAGRMLEIIRREISLQRLYFMEKTGVELPMTPSDYTGVFDWMASANLALVKAGTKTKPIDTVENKDKWFELADGIKGRLTSLDAVRDENPVLIPFLPVDSQTDLNGTRLTLEQLADCKKFFGESFTLNNLQSWLLQRGIDISQVN